MKIEFAPAEDDINCKKQGGSLEAAVDFDWDTALEREDDRFDYGEMRFVALGLIGNGLQVLVSAEGSDEEAVRVISLRPAKKHEMRFYHGEI